MAMTKQAKAAIKAEGCRLRVKDGEYAIQLVEDTESYASGVNWYFTDDAQDAVDTAKAMRLRFKQAQTALVARLTNPAPRIEESIQGTTYVNGRRLTATMVNAELKRLGIAERLRQGRDYCYFTDGAADGWYSSSVATCWVSDLSIARWIDELAALRAEAKADGREV